ncbi:hypothetical protein ACFU6S_32605 [Streptomyces sp. NPDC057456]|uniref:hypothetical protein n=1 Tax=Streptomyces sp. NPDC057456 TaxID=3346139 RepID=UPI00367C0FF9
MTDQQPHSQPRIPGVRYRKVKRKVWVPVTYKGETKMVKREWTEDVPRLPLNLDLLYVRAAVCVAVLLTGVAVVWSTMAIGRQLGHLVPEHPDMGYLGAGAFELPWVTCLAISWVLRNQPDKAKPVNVAGWVGLGIVVAAIILDGYRVDAIEVGVLGAFVSVVAKGLWWVIIGLFHVELDDDRAGWLNSKRQDLAVERVMLGEQQRMSGTEAYLAHFGVDPAARPVIAPAVAAAELTAGPAAEDAQPFAASVPPGLPVPSVAPTPSVPSAPPSGPSVPSVPPVTPSAPAVASVPPVTPSAPAVASAPVDDPRTRVLTSLGLPLDQPGGAPAPAPAPTPAPAAPATPIGAVTIASLVRSLTTADPGLKEVDRRDELIDEVSKVFPAQHTQDPKKFAATVKRNLRVKAS